MKLTDLHPHFIGAGGEGIYSADGSPAPKRHGIGVMFDCPCGKCDEQHVCYVPFRNPLDGGPAFEESGRPAWQRTGETFETLTLRPSILRSPEKGGCGWHGYVTNGEVTSC